MDTTKWKYQSRSIPFFSTWWASSSDTTVALFLKARDLYENASYGQIVILTSLGPVSKDDLDGLKEQWHQIRGDIKSSRND